MSNGREASCFAKQWLTAMALALRPVDPDRALALLDESARARHRARTSGKRSAIAEFFRGLVLFTRRRYADAATALRRALVGIHDMGNRRGMLNVLSGVAGVADRTGRSETAAALLAGLRAARDEFATARLRERAPRRGADRANISTNARGDRDVAQQLRPLDIEATIDLALATLDEIAADGQT